MAKKWGQIYLRHIATNLKINMSFFPFALAMEDPGANPDTNDRWR